MKKKKYRAFLFALLMLVSAAFFTCLDNYRQNISYENTISDNDYPVINNVFDSLEQKNTVPCNNEVKMVIPCGNPVGIYVKSKGVMVTSVGTVAGVDGKKICPCENKLMVGDYIIKVSDIEIKDKKELIDMIKASEGKSMDITCTRDDTTFTTQVKPVKTKQGYMLGLWVKDDISGIGTLTFIDENGFAALGHSINDNDTGEFFEVSDGAIYRTKMLNTIKPASGVPGRIEGVIDYNHNNIIGRIRTNSASGISGYITREADDIIDNAEWVPVAAPEEIHVGEAYIISGISGEREYYRVEITSIDLSDKKSKNMEIKVTDERLLDLSGGIVQGMSGTPIIQDGKIVGAVTHVFVNNAARGYAISIDRMIK